jgi:hypothetical protein
VVFAATVVTISVTVAGAAAVKFTSPLYAASMRLAGVTSDEVVHVALTAPPLRVTAGQSGLVLPLIVKAKVPEGAIGVTGEAAS